MMAAARMMTALILLAGCNSEVNERAITEHDAVEAARAWMTKEVPWADRDGNPTVQDERRSWLVTYHTRDGEGPAIAIGVDKFDKTIVNAGIDFGNERPVEPEEKIQALRIAQPYVATNFRMSSQVPTVYSEGAFWVVSYSVPPGATGSSPVVAIDKARKQVVSGWTGQ